MLIDILSFTVIRWGRLLGATVIAMGVLNAGGASADVDLLRSAFIPKKETGSDQFIAENPTYDGRGVIIAVFDTGVDPAAKDLQVTTTGERKIVDIIDGSGAGDVKMSDPLEPGEDGSLTGGTGRVLVLPEGITNPTGQFRVGIKPAKELFNRRVLARLEENIQTQWDAKLSVTRHAEAAQEDEALVAAEAKAPDDRTREEQNLVALAQAKKALDDAYASSGPGVVYDCVTWHDGDNWQVVIDTNRNGDLTDDVILRPYGVAGEYARFDAITNATFGVQIYEEGRLLSIVTTGGAHGTHVASIAAGYDPADPARNGVAPGARILSVQIGDVRVGSSAYGIGERRALAAAASYGVDVTNISFGGSSTNQDGSDLFSTVMNRLVESYDILTVMSAGNEGPALSTAGSAGAEADFVLGVGAYASAEMGKILYSTIKDSPDAALQFTSRGPTKDGDIGVDIMAPGAAWASLSAETVSAAGMYNGTSMASPSAAGVAALVISAAKQNDLNPRPALMRQALMLGATPIRDEAVFTTGAGMVHAGGAWAKLQQLADRPEFDLFYERRVSGGTFMDQGRGVYLREPINDRRRKFSADIGPLWTESTDLPSRAAFEADFTLRPADDWIEVADFMHMANGRERVRFIANLPEQSPTEKTNGGILTSRIDGLVAGAETLGPAWSLPITVVRPADPAIFDKGRHRTTINLSPAVTARRFYHVPPGVQKLHVTAKHRAEDPIMRGFMIQVVAVGAQTPYSAYQTEAYAWLEEGDEFSAEAEVLPGSVVEVAINQFFTSVGPAELELELEWFGVGVASNPIVVEPNQTYQPIEFIPPMDLDVAVEAKLTDAVMVRLPRTTELFHSDERGKRPATPMVAEEKLDQDLRLTYEVTFEKATSAKLWFPTDYDAFEGFSGWRYRVVHESGAVLHQSFGGPRGEVDFPKGKSTIVTELSTLFPGILENMKTLPLRFSIPLKAPLTLPIMAREKDIFHGGPGGTMNLVADRQEIIFLKNTAMEAVKDLTPSPSFLSGELTFKTETDDEITAVPLRYLAGEVPSAVTDQDPKSAPADDLKTPTETLADSVYDLQLAYVREHRLSVDAEIVERRTALLDALAAERPDDPAILIERATEGAILAGLASELWGKLPSPEAGEETTATDEADAGAPEANPIEKSIPAEAEILAWLDQAEALADPEGVSRFFGAKPVALPGDLSARDQIAAQEKEWTRQREALATINRLRTDIHRGAGRIDEVWQSWAELQRWETERSEDSTKLLASLYRAADLVGLALETLNEQIADDPMNADLLQQRIELYRELGWEDHAVAAERLLAVRSANLERIKVL